MITPLGLFLLEIIGSSSNRTDENNFQVIIDCLVFLFIIHFHYSLYKYLSPYPSSP